MSSGVGMTGPPRRRLDETVPGCREHGWLRSRAPKAARALPPAPGQCMSWAGVFEIVKSRNSVKCQ